MLNDVRPLYDVDSLADVHKLYDVLPLNNVQGLHDVAPISLVNRYTTPGVFNTRSEKANSLLDVVLGESQRDVLLDEQGLGWSKDIPLINLITGTAALFEDKYGEPIRRFVSGKQDIAQTGKEIGINTLIEASEDLDIFSNLIKSQNPLAGGELGSIRTFLDALGYGGERKVYNFNTGNFFSDVFLETVSDPLTMAELALGATKNIGKEGAEAIAKQAAKESSEEITEQTAQVIAKSITQYGDNIPYNTIVKNINKTTTQKISEAAVERAAQASLNALKTNGYKYFVNAATLKAGIDTFDSVLTKAIWYITPAGIPKDLLSYSVKKLANAIYNTIKNTFLKDADSALYFIKDATYRETVGEAVYKNEALIQTVYKNNKDKFSKAGLDFYTFQKDFENFLFEKAINLETIDFKATGPKSIRERFINYMLDKHFPIDDLSIKNIEVLRNNFREALDNILEEPENFQLYVLAPLQIYRLTKDLTEINSTAIINSLEKYIKAHRNNLTAIYDYIDKVLLKGYGLENFESYLKALLSTHLLDKNDYIKLSQLLESLGLSSDNFIQIKNILNSNLNDNEKNKALLELIQKTNKNTNIITEEYYEKISKDMKDRVENNAKKQINNFYISEDTIEQRTYIQNMEEAVVNLMNKQGIEHSVNYIEYAIRSQDFIDLATFKKDNELLKEIINNEIEDLKQSIVYTRQDLYKRYGKYALEDAIADTINIKKESITLKEIALKELEATEQFIEQTDKLLSDLKTNPLKACDEIIAWYQNLENIRKTIVNLRIATMHNGGPYSVKTRKHLNRMLYSIDVLLSDNLVEPTCLYLSSVENITNKQLSYLGMVTQINQHAYLDTDPAAHALLLQLSNPNSITRRELFPQLIKMFQDAKLQTEANELYNMLAQVDTTMHLNELLSTKLPTTFKLSKDLNDQAVYVVFDAIVNHQGYSVLDMQLSKQIYNWSNTQKELYKEFYEEIFEKTKLGRVIDDNFLEPIYDTPYERVANQINKRIDDLHLTKEGLTKTQIEELKLHCINLLNDYLNKQATIDYIANKRLASLYSKETIDILDLVNKMCFIIAENPNLTVQELNLLETFQQAFGIFAEEINMGIDDIEKINKKLSNPLEKGMLSKRLRQISERYNLYTASIASGVYTTNDYLKKSAERYGLNTDAFDCNNEELQKLSNKINMYAEIKHEDYKYDAKYIQMIREALIETYSAPHALYAPKDPVNYFNSLNEQQILTWEVLTKGDLSVRNRTAYYTAWDIITKKRNANTMNETIADQIGYMESILVDSPYTSSDVYIDISKIARNADAIRYAIEPINTHLGKTLHNFEDLDVYRDSIKEYLEKDITTATDVINTIADIEADEEIATSYYLDPLLGVDLNVNNAEDFDSFTKRTYGYALMKQNSQKAMRTERTVGVARSVYNWSAEEIAAHIQQQTPGGLVFYNNNIVQTLNPDGTITWSGFDNPFNFTQKELKKAGLKMKKVTIEGEGDWYLFALTDEGKRKIRPQYVDMDYAYPEIQEKYNKDIFEKYGSYLNPLDPTNVPIKYMLAETLNKDAWETFLEEYADFFGIKKTQKMYQKYKYIGSNNFFNKSFNRLNLTVVGGYDAFYKWNMRYSKGYIPSSFYMSRNTLSGMLAAIDRANKINKYITMFFNSDYVLTNPLLVKMFSESSDKDINDFFDKRDYRVVLLKQDKHNLPVVVEFKVNNKHSLERAKSLGAIMVPKETYWNMVNIVNSRQMTNNLLDIYRRVVPSTFKSMYLFTLGFPFRNGLDSLLFKNINEMGGLEALPDVIDYEYKASKAMELHDKIQYEILERTDGDTFNKKATQEILLQHSLEEREIYYLTDIFLQSGASGGLSKSLSDWLEHYNKINTDDLRPIWERLYEDDFLFAKLKTYPWTPEVRAHPLNPLAHLRELNNNIEQTARFGLFLASVDAGLPIPDAIDRVIKTHFNYNSGEELIDLCERIFWFSTFPINNFNYYMNGGLTKAPNLIRFLMDTQTASWNNGEYTYEELKKTNFLAYHALTGNIRIGNWIVKTSPSLFDFLNVVTDLPSNLRSRLNPVYSIALGVEKNPQEELNPFITQWRNYQKFKEGNPIPSVLSKINEYDWTRTLGKWRSPYRKTSSWNKYPRIRKVPQYTQKVRKYYVRRYKTNVRNFSRVSLYKEAVNWYRVGKTRYFDV